MSDCEHVFLREQAHCVKGCGKARPLNAGLRTGEAPIPLCGAKGPLSSPDCQRPSGHDGEHRSTENDVLSRWPRRESPKTTAGMGACDSVGDREPPTTNLLADQGSAESAVSSPNASPARIWGCPHFPQLWRDCCYMCNPTPGGIWDKTSASSVTPGGSGEGAAATLGDDGDARASGPLPLVGRCAGESTTTSATPTPCAALKPHPDYLEPRAADEPDPGDTCPNPGAVVCKCCFRWRQHQQLNASRAARSSSKTRITSPWRASDCGQRSDRRRSTPCGRGS